MLLSHSALPQDAYTNTLYTMYEYVRVLVLQFAAIILISYQKIGRLSFSSCPLLLLLSNTSTETLVGK